MTIKHQPATPLPWTAYAMGDRIEVYQDDGQGNGDAINVTTRDGQPNAAYIAHAANAYPKLVQALRDAAEAIQNPMGARRSKDGAAAAANALLKKLGEAQ